MKRVLITGGAGFVGSHLCDRLLADGHHVVAMDNLITGALANIQHLQAHPHFRFIKHNVSEYITYNEPLDAVMHFASPASPVDYLNEPVHTLKVGSLGTLNALGLAKAKGARFMIASTSEVYGDPEVSPQREDYWGHVNPIGPRSVYDEAKRFAEAITMAYRRTHNVNTVIIRIFNTYGPRMRLNDGRVVPNFIDQGLHGQPLTIYGDGKQTRSFCYVSDLVDGIVRLLWTQELGPVNLGNPNEFTMLQLADVLQTVLEKKLTLSYKPLPVDDPKQRKPDIGKARGLLGWEPKIELAEGLERTIAYFRSQA